MPPRGERGRPRTAEERARISKGTRYGVRIAREKRRMRQPVLDAYSQDGVVGEPMKPLLSRAQQELAGWIQARGGVDAVSELERSVLDDAAMLGVVRDALLAMFLENPDPELATRISTLTGARRSSLQTVGLERKERNAISLDQYLAQHAAQSAAEAPEDRPERTNAIGSDADIVDVGEVRTERVGGDE